MANTATRFVGQVAPVAEAEVYLVPAATKAIPTEIHVDSDAAGDVTFTVLIVPSGGSALKFLSNITVPAGGFYQQGLKQVLNTGDRIRFSSSAAGLNVFISGVAVT